MWSIRSGRLKSSSFVLKKSSSSKYFAYSSKNPTEAYSMEYFHLSHQQR